MVSIEQGLSLFKAFDFLNASGNLMILISDGRDDQLRFRGQMLDDMVLQARRSQIPIFMIRTAWKADLGDVPQDKIWQAAVERTGVRFYPAPNEDAILHAIDEIDRLSAGRIDVRRYTSERPQFSGYMLIAVALWVTAGAMKIGIPVFRTFP